MNIISADKIFDGFEIIEHAQLVIEHGCVVRIEAINANANEHINGLLAPGFVDLQVNGGGGVLFNQQPTLAGLETIYDAHHQFGTCAMLPTLISDNINGMCQAASAVALAIKDGSRGIVGIHFEGPHLSLAKKGAHSAQFMRPISAAEWQLYSRSDLGLIKITIAPENVSTTDIKRLAALGVIVFLGHSNADYACAQAALDAGASGFTHLFNAMSPMTSREPGMVGAALFNETVACGLIVDGHHVDYISGQIVLKSKTQGSVFLVTDAMPVVGTDIERFSFFDREIIRHGDKLNATSGELAGSALDMASAVRNTVVHLKQPLNIALNMASLYPAQHMGLADKRGHLLTGAMADLVAIDDDMLILNTWLGGVKQVK